MDASTLKKLIKQGEGLQIELKSAKQGFPQSAYESIAAFLNRNGGHLILGVEDDGKIIGVDANKVDQYKKEFVSSLYNTKKIYPPIYNTLEEILIDGKHVLYSYIPEGSMVYRIDGYKIYDRNEDGDFEITNHPTLVSECYLRKKSTYSENKIYPYATMEDLDSSTFERVRKIIRTANRQHPWLEVDDLDLMKSAGFYTKDMETGKEGMTLGGILVLGKEKTIQAVLPHYKTDVIVTIQNTDRYDARDDIRCNLLEAYERMMNMVQLYLKEGFFLEHGVRISPRDIIFREVIVNHLIHREYLSQYPARMLIEKDRVILENGNRPHGFGLIDPMHCMPFPKNPNLARFFKEIGLAEELGSGIRNCVKLLKVYSGNEPEFIEGDIFKTIIPLKSMEEFTTEKEEMKQRIIDYMKLYGSMKRLDIEKLLDIKKTKAVQLLNELIKDDVIIRDNQNIGTSYQLKS